MQIDDTEIAQIGANLLDYLLLNPGVTEAVTLSGCRFAKDHGMASVVVHPCYVRQAGNLLRDSSVSLATVINYPYGTSTTQAKVAEAKRALMEGAQELSTPINAGYIFGEMDDLLLSDLRALCGLARMNNARCGVIVDVSVFSNEQIQKAAQLANSAGADRLLFSVSPQKNITDVIKILQMVDGLHFDSLKFGIMSYITQIEQLSTLINAGFSRVGVENPQNILT